MYVEASITFHSRYEDEPSCELGCPVSRPQALQSILITLPNRATLCFRGPERIKNVQEEHRKLDWDWQLMAPREGGVIFLQRCSRW